MTEKQTLPPQHQDHRPGIEAQMHPQPVYISADTVASFGASTPMQRPGQPAEVAPAYVYLACSDSSYVAGQVIHINGGSVVNR